MLSFFHAGGKGIKTKIIKRPNALHTDHDVSKESFRERAISNRDVRDVNANHIGEDILEHRYDIEQGSGDASSGRKQHTT